MKVCKKDSTKKDQHVGSKKRKIIASIILIVLSAIILHSIIIPAMQGNLHFLIVLSGSMEPSIHTGDIVVSSKVDIKDLKEGDVITFRYEGEKNCITHRITKIMNTEFGMFFKTKGDANEDEDARLVKDSEIIGKVVFVIPYLGYLPVFVKTPLGYITLIVIPGLLIIVNELMKIKAKISKRRSSK